jgi:hypothetical protein
MLRKHKWHNVAQALSNPDDSSGYGTYGGGGTAYDETYPSRIYKPAPDYTDDVIIPKPAYVAPDYIVINPEVAAANMAMSEQEPVIEKTSFIPNYQPTSDIVENSGDAPVETHVFVVDESGQKVGMINSEGDYSVIHEVPPETELSAVVNNELVPVSVETGKAVDTTSGDVVSADVPSTTDAGIGGSIKELAKSLGILPSDANTVQMTTEKKTILLATGIAAIGILALMFKK